MVRQHKRFLADLCCGMTQGFQSVYKPQRTGAVQFAELLDAVANVDPEMRIRFTSPHPNDFSDDVLEVMLMAKDMLLLLLLLHVAAAACCYVLLLCVLMLSMSLPLRVICVITMWQCLR